MAKQHLEPTDPAAAAGPPASCVTGGDALASYLRAQATEFLRALRLHRETGAGAHATGTQGAAARGTGAHAAPDGAAPDGPVDAARALRRAARRLSGTLHTFQPLLDTEWAESMRPELAWLSGTLALEHAYASRLERLLQALHRLSGTALLPSQQQAGRTTPTVSAPLAPTATRPSPTDRGSLTVGAAKAGALLDRQLTLARTRAHSTALQALGSSRFHAVADKVALLASEVPLKDTTVSTTDLRPLAAAARDRLTDAVAALPLVTAGNPYNAQALIHGLSPDPAPHPQDTQWHQVRLLLRLHRYALEVLSGGYADETDGGTDVRLLAAGEALDRHRDASEAAAAAAQAARTPRIAPATAYALGVLHADQRHEVEAARYAFQHSWRKEPIRLP
ncbi:CHAD domain-containing protein [Streptomyces sp. NPDC018321]|uniref:CHAD domain-containing protein n=1 Tax=unclassified Streptomyces TaxID=2593676 RepID=UPI0037B90C2B